MGVSSTREAPTTSAGTLLAILSVHNFKINIHSAVEYMQFKNLTLIPFCATTVSSIHPGCLISRPPILTLTHVPPKISHCQSLGVVTNSVLDSPDSQNPY